MSSWLEFAKQDPELAAFGQARFQPGVAYLATVRADGGPRVHPVTPIIGEQLYLFMEATSPKGQDLQRDGRYALHCAVEDSGGGGGEFYVRRPDYPRPGDTGRVIHATGSVHPVCPDGRICLYESVRGGRGQDATMAGHRLKSAIRRPVVNGPRPRFRAPAARSQP